MCGPCCCWCFTLISLRHFIYLFEMKFSLSFIYFIIREADNPKQKKWFGPKCLINHARLVNAGVAPGFNTFLAVNCNLTLRLWLQICGVLVVQLQQRSFCSVILFRLWCRRTSTALSALCHSAQPPTGWMNHSVLDVGWAEAAAPSKELLQTPALHYCWTVLFVIYYSTKRPVWKRSACLWRFCSG